MSETIQATPKPRLFYGYFLAGYSFAMGFLASSFFLHSRGVFFPLWLEEFAVNRTEISLVITLVLFTGACLAPFIGFLIDKFPVKVIICFGATWLAIGYLSLQYVDSYVGFFGILLVFQSLGWVCVGPLTQTKLMVNWFNRHRGMALGIAIMGISVAGIVTPTIATFLGDSVGWRNAYSIYAGVLIVLILPATLLLVKQDPSAIGQHTDGDPLPEPEAPAPDGSCKPLVKENAIQVYKEFLTSKAFWSVVITFTLMNGVYSALMTHLPSYLTDELSFGAYEAAYALGVAGGFAIAGKIVFGWLMDHFDAKKTVLIAVTAYLASTMVFMTAQSYMLILVAAGLFGTGFGGMVPVRSVLLSRLFGVAKFSRVNGLFSFFLAPATFWVVITGWITDMTDTYVTAFQVWAIAFTLAGIITSLIKLPNREDAVA